MNPLFLQPAVIGITAWLLGLMSTTISWIVGAALFFYTLIPLGASLYLLRTHKISSLDLPERKSRSRLFLLSIGCSLVALLLFYFTSGYTHPLITAISVIFLINPTIGFLINLSWKISMHTAALSSAAAIFLSLSQLSEFSSIFEADILSLTILLLLLPLMIWARYRLGVHTLAELLGGAIVGFLLTIVELSLFTNIW